MSQKTVTVRVLKSCIRGGETLNVERGIDTIVEWDAEDAPRAAKNGLVEIIADAKAKK